MDSVQTKVAVCDIGKIEKSQIYKTIKPHMKNFLVQAYYFQSKFDLERSMGEYKVWKNTICYWISIFLKRSFLWKKQLESQILNL